MASAILTACGEDPVRPPVDPYVLDLSAFMQFEYVNVGGVYCIRAGGMRRMLVARGSSGLTVQLTRVHEQYCPGSDSLRTYTEPWRALTASETARVLAVSRRVEIERALPDSCSIWMPIRNLVVRWDNHVYDRRCTIDHLSQDTVGRLFDLADSIDVSTLVASHVGVATRATTEHRCAR